MASRKAHVSETPATQLLRANGVAFTEHPYEYLDHGGGRRGYLIGIDPRVCVTLLGARPVRCALAE